MNATCLSNVADGQGQKTRNVDRLGSFERKVYFQLSLHYLTPVLNPRLEIVFTTAAPAFDILFIGCVLNTKIAYTTAEKLTFEAFY